MIDDYGASLRFWESLNMLFGIYECFLDLWKTYQVLVCAPSNVAVDQLAEKISATGLKVKILLLDCHIFIITQGCGAVKYHCVHNVIRQMHFLSISLFSHPL